MNLIMASTAAGLALASTAFGNGGNIPAAYTCDGNDLSPPLTWSGVPPGTKSLALVMNDPDAPRRTWVHWILYDIPPDAPGLQAGAVLAKLPPGTREGYNDWKRAGYGGPCPPAGRHRYVFKLYALDVLMPDLGKADKGALDKAMNGHVIGQAQLVGLYQRD